MHPLFLTAVRRPDLLAAHAGNYVDLIKEEVSHTLNGWKIRAIGGAIAVVAALLALIFTGVALMLGALHGFAWALVLVPLLTWIVVAMGAGIALKPSTSDRVQELKGQLSADLAALKIAGESRA
ncbi:MAG: hypothetical protein EOP12_05335 [Pseudomonas sp.]|nr:MAG: hypothetical protein EOP12_05335 [Pseudomonas sp.]